MKLLVTGGSGFIGSNFIHMMLHRYPHYEIINLDLLTYAGNEATNECVRNNPRYTFVRGDICNPTIVDELVSKVDAIVHFAAESHVDNSIKNSLSFVMTNVMGTHTLLEAARRHGNKRFHHISTDEVYGHLHHDEDPFHEHTPHRPRSPYSASKASSDHLVMSYFHTHGLPVTISNCSNNYGRFQFPEKLIPLFVTNLLEGKKVPLYGDGLNVRDWIHVDDHNNAVDKILHHGQIGHTYCVGASSEKTNKEITYKILELMNLGEDRIEFVEDRKGHDRRYAINSGKIQSELLWTPQISFDEGITQTVEWYIANAQWWKNIKSGEYKKSNDTYATGV
ncbi:dTDP-glucose 4,6-dehydratase [Candidatus Falkowbacteria bacterium]|nr:dTDP-glucose 4,6-dehydratase [Candidatus Falkowbacteria bacterium]